MLAAMEEEFLYLEPTECIYVGESLDEIATERTYYEGCDICDKYKFGSASTDKVIHHVKSFHCSLAVSRPLKDGRKVFTLPCRKGCMIRGGANGKRSHYHCPFCARMCGRRNNILNHFKIKCNELKWKTQQRQLPYFNRARAIENGPNDVSSNDVTFSDSGEVGTMQSTPDHVIMIMEKRLSDWIQDQRLFGKTVNLMSMLQKARSLHEKTKADLGLTKSKSFYAGKQWVKSFLDRYGMKDTMVVSMEDPETVRLPDKDIIVKIIEKVAEKPVLYDPLIAALGDHTAETAETIWKEIAESVGLESGTAAKQIWDNVEEKYQERNKPGAAPEQPWEYESYLKFLPTEIILEEEGIGSETIVQTSDMQNASTAGHRKMVTVAIQGDSEYGNGNDGYAEDSPNNQVVNVAKLKKIHLEIETMQQEHEVKMEMLQIQKNILLKKLNGLR